MVDTYRESHNIIVLFLMVIFVILIHVIVDILTFFIASLVILIYNLYHYGSTWEAIARTAFFPAVWFGWL